MHIGLLVLLAMAATPPGRVPLRLQFENCPDIDQSTVRRVVATELEAELTDGRQPDATTTAQSECMDGSIRLIIDDPVTGKSTTRTVDLEHQARSLRSRLLGLAIAEAVLASWIELRLTRESSNIPPGPQLGLPKWSELHRQAADIAERRLRAGARPRPPSWEIVAGPGIRWFSSGLFTTGLAGSARRWFENQSDAGVEVEIEGSDGEHSVPRVGHGSTASLSVSSSLLTRSHFGRVDIAASAGCRIGFARLSGKPASILRTGQTAWRGWGGPVLAVDLGVRLWRMLVLRISSESGYAIVPARGGVDSVDVVAFAGSWLGGFLSLGAKL